MALSAEAVTLHVRPATASSRFPHSPPANALEGQRAHFPLPTAARPIAHNDLKAQFHHVLRFGDSLRSTTRSLRVRRKSRPTDRRETNWFQNKAHALVAHIQTPR